MLIHSDDSGQPNQVHAKFKGQHCFRQWRVAWRHQAITWIDDDQTRNQIINLSRPIIVGCPLIKNTATPFVQTRNNMS